jgi:TerB-C domain
MFNILKTITNSLGFGVEKSEPESIVISLKKKTGAVSYNEVENIIDVSENEPSKIIYVPDYEIKSKNIAPINIQVNQDFKHLYSQLSLVGRQIEWADRLQIPYKRKFLEDPVNELQTFKLFIVLCDKTNDYLIKNYKFDLLQKLDKIAENSYYSYQDTLYTLFCISEFSINYDKTFKSSPEFSFEVLAKQIDQNLVDQIKGFLYKDLELKDPESYFITNSQSSSNYPQPNSYINTYTLFDNSFKRLRLDLKTIYYVKVLDLSKNAFLEIDQCLDETIVLYIKLILKIREYHNSIEQIKEFASKVCVTGPVKSNYGYYCFSGNEKTVSRFLTGIFKRAENLVRSQYGHSRMLDDSDFYKYNKSKLGEKLIKYLDEYCTEYITTKPNRATNIVLNKANRTKWKTEFNNILESQDDWETKFYKIDDLIDENCDNPSQNTIYLETAKKLAAFKTQELRQQSTWYYFNYSIKCYHNNTVYVVPSLDKILFNGNKEIATEFFKIIEKTQNISPQNLITQKPIIFDLFVLKRKQLNLDQSTVSQIHNNYTEMVTELNSILQDETIDDKNLITKVEEENFKIITEINIVNKEPAPNSNLIDLKIVEQNLLQFMVNKEYKISFEEFSNFTIKNNISNSIIRTINKKFFEEFEENIIEIGEEVYFINPDNQQYLTQVL